MLSSGVTSVSITVGKLRVLEGMLSFDPCRLDPVVRAFFPSWPSLSTPSAPSSTSAPFGLVPYTRSPELRLLAFVDLIVDFDPLALACLLRLRTPSLLAEDFTDEVVIDRFDLAALLAAAATCLR